MLLGLRTVIYKAPDLAQARRWYAELLGAEPYFEEPFYVGFNVGGYELGLDPDVAAQGAGPGGAVAYWGVDDVAKAVARAVAAGATVVAPAQEVGGGITVATVADPFGNLVGFIHNPHFGA
jgi:predicted enzyme related to lactoylglutathione lyase